MIHYIKLKEKRKHYKDLMIDFENIAYIKCIRDSGNHHYELKLKTGESFDIAAPDNESEPWEKMENMMHINATELNDLKHYEHMM